MATSNDQTGGKDPNAGYQVSDQTQHANRRGAQRNRQTPQRNPLNETHQWRPRQRD